LTLVTALLARRINSSSEITTIDTCDECGNDLVAEGNSKCLECLSKLSSLI
jgi:hypothetical protein